MLKKGQVTAGALADLVSDRTGMQKLAIAVVIEELFKLIQDQLKVTKRVNVIGFGSFERKIWKRKALYHFREKRIFYRDLEFIRFTPSRTWTGGAHGRGEMSKL